MKNPSLLGNIYISKHKDLNAYFISFILLVGFTKNTRF